MNALKQLSLLSLAVILLASCAKKEDNEVAVPTLKVSTRQLTANGIAETLSYSGSIEADNLVALGFLVPGRVTAVYVEEGQHVKEGQLLASIETIEYQNNVLLAEASLEQAQDNFNRLDELYVKGSLPAREHLTAKVALSQAKANKSIAAKRLTDTKLYAPFAGIVTAKEIEKGAIASSGIMAFTIVKTDLVYAKISVSESEISKLAIGTGATVTIPAINDTRSGKISILNPQADASTRSFEVKVRLANGNGKLLPGMLANINISTDHKRDVLTVPADAVVRDPEELTYVFIVDDKNRAIKKRIVIDGLSMNEIIVSEGLHIGDRVIIRGQSQLKDGQTVAL
ncbi:efflux RND transporter periplasmic adaptor subunit [Fulvivirgaceae bacterium PWU5]|uniref:Efflux RND transporter periplasmic adaptor subunit n=1 Tax=Dawidia cretensis TaxID=2782350 RepID=A0AAP2E039_9BACT|nr:efflux RND transporter periplasmic adaptor subunit [Dawidia cretensis]MBT1710305.1 efflux RND transporter periplasmic adaptor subunit [Dawidia cretensis]